MRVLASTDVEPPVAKPGAEAASSIASSRLKSCDDWSISRSSRIRMTSRRSNRRPSRGSARPSTRSTRGRFADRSSNREMRRFRERTPRQAVTPGSRVAHDVLPDRRLRQGIETEPVAPAVEPYRREFLLPKHGDDPIQRNTARAPDKFGVHEPMWPDLFGK